MAIRFLFVNFVIRTRNNIFRIRSLLNLPLIFTTTLCKIIAHSLCIKFIGNTPDPQLCLTFVHWCVTIYFVFAKNTRLYPASRKHEILCLSREYDCLIYEGVAPPFVLLDYRELVIQCTKN